jgi:hypothetical protein
MQTPKSTLNRFRRTALLLTSITGILTLVLYTNYLADLKP